MARNSKGERITLLGGKKAELLNPRGLVKQFKAICIPEHKVLSPAWRNTKAEATADAKDCIANGHLVDYDVKIVQG